MRECIEIKELIQQELDYSLTNEEQQLLARHLTECPGCEQYRANVVNIDSKLATIAKIGPHQDLAEPNLIAGIIPDLERIAEERRQRANQRAAAGLGEQQTSWWRTLVRKDWVKRYGVAAAMILLMVPVGMGINYSLNQEASEAALYDGFNGLQAERGTGDMVGAALSPAPMEEAKYGAYVNTVYRASQSANELVIYKEGVEVFRTSSWLDGVHADYEFLENDRLIYSLYSAAGEKLASYQVNLLTKEVEQLYNSGVE